MEYTIRLLPEVRQDLQVAKKWYNGQRTDPGEEFKLEVNKGIDSIGEFPQHYQRKYKELRQSLIKRFPYAIFFYWKKKRGRL